MIDLILSLFPFTRQGRQARCAHKNVDRGTDWTGFCERELDYCNDCGRSF